MTAELGSDKAPVLLRAVIWRSLGYVGVEYCRVFQTATGFRLGGHVVAAPADGAFYAHYQVTCDQQWRTRAVSVKVVQGESARRLQIAVDNEQHWWVDGQEIERLRGCQDVDLAVTPSTNTLPIRRLNLAIGGAQDVVAAWVRFPGLELEPLPQSYTRLTATAFRYESRSGRFTSDLKVDDLGLVIRYAGGWQREAILST